MRTREGPAKHNTTKKLATSISLHLTMPSYPPPQSHYVPTEGTRAYRDDTGSWLGGWLGGSVPKDSTSPTASKISQQTGASASVPQAQQTGSWSTLTNSSSSTAA